ncbi:MAG: YIP1 family protein [Verrucomicrobiota bacterium]|nr:YIP1 family protein [Verrucomicrobiota bacterium]
MNIFVTPGEVFEEVKGRPPVTANWLAPALILALVGVISALVVYSQPGVIQAIHEQQTRAFDQQVSAGKMTREQADQAMAAAEKFSGPGMLKVLVSFGAVFGSFIRVFWWAFILWLLGIVFLKARLNYLKVLEVAGLALMIGALGAVVTMLLTVILGRPAAPSLALLIGQFDPKNKLHLLLGVANLFTFWLLGVLACGLARLSGAAFARSLAVVGGCWLAWQLFLVFVVASLTGLMTGK